MFDGIEMPKEIVSKILETGSQPQTINRMKRLNNQMLMSESALAKQIEKFIEVDSSTSSLLHN